MLIRLLAAFILIPFVELILLLRMAEATSWLTTLTIVIVTGIIGSVLARREGMATIARFRSALAEGRMPGREIQDGMMIAFAAALLLTPGLLTDSLGFLLLTPFGRQLVGGYLRRRYSGRFQVHTSGFGTKTDSDSDRDFEPTRTTYSQSPGDRYTVDSPSFGPKQRQPH
ncbi:FxsA family protein [Aporhodopirellula aestuarii]|uniref:FxsA family protein n=1 Tax=Aporhodopirellula aestuarii TaxID=2950107 RepID=A0ABT0UA88_9BACT|nr:FxsA family protein [Aporhodopirellula aestuarii]MCM2373256.1 FxsA family protein [Aporhodopirellula aestuarii]